MKKNDSDIRAEEAQRDGAWFLVSPEGTRSIDPASVDARQGLVFAVSPDARGRRPNKEQAHVLIARANLWEGMSDAERLDLDSDTLVQLRVAAHRVKVIRG